MYQYVLIGVLFSAIAINASPAGGKRPGADDLNVAQEARRLVHQANWASVATISSDSANTGYPMVNLLSTADSKVGADSSGEIYFYMMGVDKVARDVRKDNKISFMFTDAQEGECNKRGDDPWSHKCARTLITGQVKRLEEGTSSFSRSNEKSSWRNITNFSWGSRARTYHLKKFQR
ncbi:uncharacterized protein LOC129919442 isoform X2 [Episyrphus balteatus]|uniref:uncharacterized protein LOC129919442 isoform X2 n=1 Tax=Episyrphus balteatus TaxID=286459 RepID=UPI0024859C90|nr:uncharacterized protein LOC129919442 isoform X2 [Episyrphus balteatus]